VRPASPPPLWPGPALAQATLRPALIRLARTLLVRQPVVVALETTRLGPWEVWLAGSVSAGRTLPSGGAGIPSPWPTGRFRATPLALIQPLPPAFPAGVRGTLGADRGLPSAGLCAQWRQGGTACSVRGRWRDWVTVARGYAPVRAHRMTGRRVVGQRTAARLGRGTVAPPRVPAALVGSAAVVTPPRHQQHPGTANERAHRAQQPAQPRQHKPGRKTPPPRAGAQRSAHTWGLGTTASTVAQAVAESAGRMAIEETSREWPHHGAVRAAVRGLPTEARGARLLGGVCLASTGQRHLGQRVRREPRSQQRRAQWTVTGRIRWFWCGQRLFTDPGYDGSRWLAQQWERLGQWVSTASAPPMSKTASLAALEEAA